MASQHIRRSLSIEYALVAVLLIFSGCDRSKVSEHTHPSADIESESVEQIRSAYGVSKYHLGMSIEELGEGWAKLSDEYLFNKHAGIGVSFEDGHVIHINFKYFGKDFTPCGLITEKGASAESKRNDVIDTYGEPSYVGKTTVSEFGDFPGATEISVNYVEDGIDFDFIDGKLESIGVYKPVVDFDYESLRDPRSSGWVIFVRPLDSERRVPSQTRQNE